MSVRGEIRLTAEGVESVLPLNVPRFTIGRGEENSLCVRDLLVSRCHAEITEMELGFYLRDLGSRNGTYVNGARITAQMLNDGDRIRLGEAGPELLFRQPEGQAWDTTKDISELFPEPPDLSGVRSAEAANLRCAQVETYLRRGQHGKARDAIAKYTDPARLGALDPPIRAGVLLAVGRAYADCRQHDVALPALRQSLDLYTRAADEGGVAVTQAALGRALMGTGDLLGARDSLHRSLLAARRAGNTRACAEVHLLLGKVDWREGDFEGARYNWQRAARLSEGLDDDFLLARVQLQQAFVLYTEGKLQEAVPAYQAAIDRAKAVGNVPLQLKADSSLAVVLIRLGLWASAERLLGDRLRLAREKQLQKAEAIALTDLAETQFLQGKLSAATENIEAALRCHGGTVYARTQRVLAHILGARGKPQEAIEALRKGLAAASGRGALSEQVLAGLDLTLAHLEVGDLAAANRQLQATTAITSLEPTLSLLGLALYTRGAVHAACDQVFEANRHYTQSLSIFQSIGDPFRAGQCHAAIGALRSEMGRPESARAHLEEAERIFKKHGAALELQRARERLARPDVANANAVMTQFQPGLSRAAPLSMAGLTMAEPETIVPVGPPRVLVAVTDDQLAGMLARGLEAENFVVERVRDGRAALERARGRDHPFRVLVLDALLEYHSGFDVCRELRKGNPETPVVLLGGRQGVEDKIEALQAGADDFLAKQDLVFEELLAKMEALLR